MTLLSKSEIRRNYLHKRVNFPEAERKNADKDLKDNFFKNVVLEPNSVVAGYWPIKAEADVLPIMNDLIKCSYTCVLPNFNSTILPLTFSQWHEGVKMHEGLMHIMQPVGQKEYIPDVLLVPLVAFDENRARIGYGGGMFDRSIAALRKRKPVFIIGIGYEFQKVERIPTDENDMAMDMIVTDQEVYI